MEETRFEVTAAGEVEWRSTAKAMDEIMIHMAAVHGHEFFPCRLTADGSRGHAHNPIRHAIGFLFPNISRLINCELGLHSTRRKNPNPAEIVPYPRVRRTDIWRRNDRRHG
jgi:hypothetical protein